MTIFSRSEYIHCFDSTTVCNDLHKSLLFPSTHTHKPCLQLMYLTINNLLMQHNDCTDSFRTSHNPSQGETYLCKFVSFQQNSTHPYQHLWGDTMNRNRVVGPIQSLRSCARTAMVRCTREDSLLVLNCNGFHSVFMRQEQFPQGRWTAKQWFFLS